jgi:hypothetical protein
MDMEARSYSPDQVRQLLQRVKEFKADLGKLKEDARRASAGGAAGGGADARAELGIAGSDFFQTSAGQRDRLLTGTDRLNKTSDRIQQGRQQLLETEVGGRWAEWRDFVCGVCHVMCTAGCAASWVESSRFPAWPAHRIPTDCKLISCSLT